MSNKNEYFPLRKNVGAYGNIGRNYRVFDFVRDASLANTAIAIDSFDFIKSPGKLRPFRLSRFPVLCEGTGSCDTDVCTMEGTKVELVQTEFDITQCIASPVYTLEKDDVRYIDENWTFSYTFRQMLLSAMPEMRRRIAVAMTQRLYDLAGVHTDGTPTKRLITTNNSNGVVNPMGRFQIDREYMDAGLGAPYIFGGSEVYNWQNMVKIGGLNANGQRIDQLNTNNTYYDDGLSGVVNNDVANGDWVLTLDPQTFKFVTYSANSGIFTTGLVSINDIDKMYQVNGMSNLLEGTYFDPVSKLLFDLYVKYDCHKWHVMLKFNWDFLSLPNVSCGVQGMNGIMKWRTCPPVVTPCPTGSPIASPAASKTYSWTPTLADIPTVSKVVIGGVTWTSREPVVISNIAGLTAVLNEAYAGGSTLFTVSGSNIVYSGFTALSGKINDDVTVTFA